MADATTLRTKLAYFTSIDPKSLMHRVEWGTIDFRAAEGDIGSIYEIVHLLDDLPLDRLPANAIQSIANSLENCWQWVEKINKFDLEGSPGSKRDEIVNNLAIQQQELYINTQQWVPFLAYLKGDIPAQLRSITSSVSAASSQFDDFKKFSDQRSKDIDEIVRVTREASAKAGVGVFTDEFLNDATARENEAKSWLDRATISAVVTVLTAVAFFWIRAPENQYAVIQFSTSKIVILAMLIAVSAWCAGNYKANKHQAVVSRHKAHSLRTFQAFVQATENPAVKDAVLMETTRAIFSHNQTGYLKADGAPDNPSRIVEIIKGNSEASSS